jgi:hypothetical protein
MAADTVLEGVKRGVDRVAPVIQAILDAFCVHDGVPQARLKI